MVDVPGLLSDAYSGWEDWWHPKNVPTGAAYDAETLGSARAGAIGNIGGNLLALAQGGLSPETRAQLMLGIGKTPLTYQQSILAGVEGRLHGAQAAQAEQEVASTKEFSSAINAELQRRVAGGTGGAGGAATAGMAGTAGTAGTVGARAPVVGGDGVAGYSRSALAALKGPESGGKANLQNEYGYSGLYQIGTGLANSAGLYQPAQDEAVSDAKGRAVNAWRGQWTIPGFEPMTHQQFLANPQAQQAAGEAAMAHNWKDIQRQGLDKYVGQTIGNVTLTPQGLLQAAWLGGVGGLKTWLSGQGDPTDANKTKVSQWAGLQAPGTASDAGVAQPVPQGGGPGGGAGGAVAGTDAPVRRGSDLSALTPQQLTLMKGMPAKEARQYLLNLQNKIEPTRLSATAIGQYGLDARATWVWDENGAPKKLQDAPFQRMTDEEVRREGLNPGAKWGRDEHGKPVQIEEAQSAYLTPQEVAARPNLNPQKEYQRDSHGNIKEVGERPAEQLTDQQKIDLKIPVSASAYRKADGTVTLTTQGVTRWATPEEKTSAGYPPDAKLLIKPDGTVDERDKGTNPYAPLNDADAQGVLIRYAPQVRAKILDPNSAEGLRYKAAYDLLSKGKFEEVQQSDGTTQSVWRTQPMSFPRLGAAPETPTGVTVKNAPPLTEAQGKATLYLGTLRGSEEDIDRLAKGGFVPTDWRTLIAHNTPEQFANFLRTSEGRQFKQAQDSWAEAYLRTVSGAVFGPKESADAADRLFPRPGDDPGTIKQKERTRARIQAGIETMAGPGAGSVKPRGDDENLPPAKQIVDEIQARLNRHELNWDQAVFLAKKRGLDSFLTRPGQQ